MKGCICKDFTIREISGKHFTIGKRKVIISAHKPREAEQLIFQLNYKTPLTKLVTQASKKSILRGLCFLSHDRLYQTLQRDRKKQEQKSMNSTVIIPFYPRDNSYDIEEAVKEKIKATDTISKEATEAINTIGEALFSLVGKSLLRTVRHRITESMHRGRRSRITIKGFFEDVGKFVTKDLKRDWKRNQEAFQRINRITEVQRLTPTELYRTMAINTDLKAFLKKLQPFEDIYRHLVESTKEKSPEILCNVLQKLASNGITYGGVANSICLNPECSYSSIQYAIVPSLEKCPLCKGTMLTLYSFHLDEDVKACWELGLLQEIIIAHILDEQKWTKNVWVHKAIVQKKDGDYSESLWIDIICQTKEDKIILVDVTTQMDLSNILMSLRKKHKLLSDSHLEFDGVFCVSSAYPLDKYINPLGSIFVFGSQHLDKIYSHMEHVYNNIMLKRELKS